MTNYIRRPQWVQDHETKEEAMNRHDYAAPYARGEWRQGWRNYLTQAVTPEIKKEAEDYPQITATLLALLDNIVEESDRDLEMIDAMKLAADLLIDTAEAAETAFAGVLGQGEN